MVNINPTLLIQVISFLILMYGLYKILYKPVTGFLDNRSVQIKKWIGEAEKAREDSVKEREEAKAFLHEAREEAEKIREKVETQAEAERTKAEETAKEEAKRIVQEAKAEVNRELERAKRELQKEVGTLSILVAEKIIRRELTEKDHQRLVEESLKEVRRLS